MASSADVETRLRESFGFGGFRPGQRELVETVLAGRDALGILPTGGGKSLTYQLPATLLDGLTVVVSPLIALMKDQVDELRGRRNSIIDEPSIRQGRRPETREGLAPAITDEPGARRAASPYPDTSSAAAHPRPRRSCSR